MKKLILLILLIPSLLFAGPLQQAHKRVIAGQTVAGGTEVCYGFNGAACDTTDIPAAARESSGTFTMGESFTLSASAEIVEMRAYVYTAGSHQPATLRMAIYDDDSGTPDALVCYYTYGTTTGGAWQSWVAEASLTYANSYTKTLAAGTYYLMQGCTSCASDYLTADNTEGNGLKRSNSYTPDPWSNTVTDQVDWSIGSQVKFK